MKSHYQVFKLHETLKFELLVGTISLGLKDAKNLNEANDTKAKTESDKQILNLQLVAAQATEMEIKKQIQAKLQELEKTKLKYDKKIEKLKLEHSTVIGKVS